MARHRRLLGLSVTSLAILALTARAHAEPSPPPAGPPNADDPAAPAGDHRDPTEGAAESDPPAPPPPVEPTAAEAATASPTAPLPSAPAPSEARSVGAPAPAPASPTASDPRTMALVEIHARRSGCWLELRPALGEADWRRACALPCSATLVVDGREARVAGDGVTPSNPFLIEPGHGTARLEARPGSARARQYGTVALVVGIPLALAGFAGYALGRLEDSPPLRDSGIALTAVGGAAILTALPLLAAGSTSVRNERGRRIAAGTDRTPNL